MKPWEETWSYQAIRNRVVVEEAGGYFTTMDLDHDSEYQPPKVADERGRLAAAAPEMARLLLELEWFHYDHCRYPDETRCIACRETQAQGHAADCRLVAALRKAGVVT